jgi:hypothetical protein
MKTKLNCLIIVFLLLGLILSCQAQSVSAQNAITITPNAVYGIYSTIYLTTANEGVESWAITEGSLPPGFTLTTVVKPSGE